MSCHPSRSAVNPIPPWQRRNPNNFQQNFIREQEQPTEPIVSHPKTPDREDPLLDRPRVTTYQLPYPRGFDCVTLANNQLIEGIRSGPRGMVTGKGPKIPIGFAFVQSGPRNSPWNESTISSDVIHASKTALFVNRAIVNRRFPFFATRVKQSHVTSNTIYITSYISNTAINSHA